MFTMDGRGVRDFLDEKYPLLWCSRSSDLTPLDFYLWGVCKSFVYKTEVSTWDELKQRIKLLQLLRMQAILIIGSKLLQDEHLQPHVISYELEI